MAKVKEHWYVLVFTEEGPKYVTSVDYVHHDARWDVDEVPKEMTKEQAHEITRGLCWNGHTAAVICSQWEIENNPYRYNKYHIQWVENEEVENHEQE